MISLSASAIITNEKNEILLIKGPKRGWEFPGGVVESNETIEEAVIREVKEETGYNVRVNHICSVHHNLKENVLNVVFLGEKINGNAKTSTESIIVGFYSKNEASKMVNYSNFMERIKSCFDSKNILVKELITNIK